MFRLNLDGSENIPYSQNFMDIVKMVQNGQTPPNVRTDIVDKPEDPEKPFDVQGELGKKPKVRTACLDLILIRVLTFLLALGT